MAGPHWGPMSQQLAMQGRAGWGAVWGREKAEDPVLAVSLTVGALTCPPGIPALGQGLG